MVVTVLSEPSHRSLQRDSWEHDKKCSPRSLQTHHLQTQNLSDLKEELEDSIEFEEKQNFYLNICFIKRNSSLSLFFLIVNIPPY